RGPSVTRYEVQPAPDVKVSKITNLSDDIALNLAAEGVRIEAPIPGKPAIGIEVPNSQKDTVSLRELLEAPEFRNSKSKLTFGVGKDIAGNVIIGDIAKMPHMIIAGATGSGKSVCTNSIIMSILYHAAPDEVKLILIDPKIVEFRVYDGIPHLLIPVVTDPKKAAGALNWAVQEMLRRYDVFAKNSVRNLEDYNRICIEKPELNLDKMPQIVICIDELADLMMTASKEVEEAICRLAQLARAAGMHLIIATQRPTTDIITGLIKANIPSRIALSVMSQIDSRIILDTGGAEKLLGHGDMLYLPSGQPKPVRVQGCYVSTQEIENVVTFIKNQSVSETGYDEQIIQAVDQMAVTGDKKSKSSSEEPAISGDADLIEQAIEVVVAAGQASTSNLQRRLRLGYARAARIMDELESMGIIGAYEGAKPRKVLMSPLELEQRKMHRKGN
ncbi:MAG: DNA translocase FtsK, partial [Oscillospiraceae bacterium]|nr:DNA translocase FtsK [Oscillospiraceae bacterium]